MGFFDEWQEQDDSDYILATDYVEQLAIQHDSSIKATANYLLKEVGFNTPLYFKHPKGYFEKDKTGYDEENNFDESPYTFIAHILENISDYKHSSFKTDASHIALRYADRYFFKKGLPTIQISDAGTNKTDPLIEANAKLHQELEEERANGSFFMGTPTVSQTEPRSDKEVIELLRQEIAALESQLAQAQTANTPADAVELKGLDKYNVKKAMAITTAKAIAKYIWSMDNSQAIRTGDMVQQIRHVMHNIEPELLPDDKAIRGWLSDIAPDYATKGGKPPKDASNKIPLIMKK